MQRSPWDTCSVHPNPHQRLENITGVDAVGLCNHLHLSPGISPGAALLPVHFHPWEDLDDKTIP